MNTSFFNFNDGSSAVGTSSSSLGISPGSSEESFFTDSKALALLDSPQPKPQPNSLLSSLLGAREGFKLKNINNGSIGEGAIDKELQPAVVPHRHTAKKSSIFGVCANLVNSMVGGGIVGIPYAFKLSGFVTGVYLLILTAILSGKLIVVL